MLSCWNQKAKLKSVILFFILSGLSTVGVLGCQSVDKFQLPVLEPGRSVQLQFKGKAGDERSTRYHSHSYIREYELDQVIKEKDELVDFTVVEKVKKSRASGHLRIDVTSKDKDGIVNLHDLAFPEVDEVIPYVYDPQGNVLMAGGYPEESIFYVPPLPLPKDAVEVGDTWEKTSKWISLKNGVPLQVSIVGILKNLYDCQDELCADIEVSGEVQVLGIKKDQVSFLSEITGRILYSVDRGLPVWSKIKSTEDLRLETTRTLVQSCVVSKLSQPASLADWIEREKLLNCEPKKPAVGLPK